MLPINQKIIQINNKSEVALKEAYDRIVTINDAFPDDKSSIQSYFASIGQYLMMLETHGREIADDSYYIVNNFETLQARNRMLYEDILPENYSRSFVNPTYAVEMFGKELGQILSSVAYMFRECIGYTYEQHLGELLRAYNLYLALHKVVIVNESRDIEEIAETIRMNQLENVDDSSFVYWFRSISPEFNAYNHIVDTADLTDLRYLFRYGMYVGTNEIDAAKHMLTLSHTQLQRIANTMTEAYERGFERKSVSLKDKNASLVTYHIGWERVIRYVYANLRELGLEPVVYYHLRAVQRPRLYNTKPNRQMEYDHRFSDGVYFNEFFKDALVESNKRVLHGLVEVGAKYAGLALMEPFGETPFSPENSDANVVYSQEMNQLKSTYKMQLMAEYRKVVKGDNYSFTINSYPLPSVGDQFEAIYEDIIKVNTLDEKLFDDIHDKMINALDNAEYVCIKGAKGNETDLKVALQTISNPTKETKFSNCTADVNVPVGEVFTTPLLEGTNGLLHVGEVYLQGFKYNDLKIWFEDGMIAKYDCKNFGEDVDANKNFVHETLIHPHQTLPLGEFAIGTNTKAYMVAKKYQIGAILPILIGEKTGPHFAIGDTCYLWAEDQKTYNSNGKEIKVKDNAISIQRHENVEKAYLNKHTDITIPYHELDSIIGYDGNNGEYKIIEGGRFVLEGTEVLNLPFDEDK